MMNFFSLVTCFDVLEHLDEPDILVDLAVRFSECCDQGEPFSAPVSCRKAGSDDKFGDNLHRTVRSVEWWLDQLKPDRLEFDARPEPADNLETKPGGPTDCGRLRVRTAATTGRPTSQRGDPIRRVCTKTYTMRIRGMETPNWIAVRAFACYRNSSTG